MPRSYDTSVVQAARGTGTNSDYSPLFNLLSFTDPLSDTGQQAGNMIVTAIQEAFGQLFGLIQSLTGIDLSPILNLLTGLLGATTTDPTTGDTSTGIDISGYTSTFDPLNLLLSLISSISSVIGIGDLGTVLPQILSAFQGIDLSNPGSILTAIETAIEDLVGEIPGLGPLIDELLSAFTGGDITSGDTDLLGSVIDDFMGLFGGLTGLGTGSASLTDDAPNIPFFQKILDPSAGSFFPNLIGSLSSDLLPQLNIGNLTSAPTNMLKFPLFSNAAEIVGQGIWSFDDTVTVPGASAPGAVKVTANGVTETLYSNIVQVTAGDNISEAISAVWSGLSSTGSPIQLIGKVYDSARQSIDTPVLASVATPGASGSQRLSGTYTVPEGGAYMTMAPRLLSNATAGDVWFGNGAWSKSNQIPGGNVLGLSGGGATIVDDLESLLTGGIFRLGSGGSGSLIDQFLNGLTAIPGTNILGMSGSGSTLLGDFQSFIDQGTSLLTGVTSTNNQVAALINALSNFPNGLVQGVQGADGIGDTIQGFWDQLFHAVTGQVKTGVAASDVSQAMATVAANAQSAVALAQTVSTSYAPVQQIWTTAGSYVFTLPTWISHGDTVDLVTLGGGNGGEGEYGAPVSSPGGLPGTWAARRLIYGTDIPTGTTQLQAVVGAGGSGAGFYWSDGQPGAASTWALMNGTQLLSGAGGNGFTSKVGQGGSPGNYTFESTPYTGGGVVTANQPGSSPGGGGGGAFPFSTGSGTGADGLAAIVVSKAS